MNYVCNILNKKEGLIIFLIEKNNSFANVAINVVAFL